MGRGELKKYDQGEGKKPWGRGFLPGETLWRRNGDSLNRENIKVSNAIGFTYSFST